MPFVKRDGNGDIHGINGRPQPGVPEEFLPEDDPEVQAWRNRHDRSDSGKTETTLNGDVVMRGLVAFLADQFSMTPRAVVDAIKAKL